MIPSPIWDSSRPAVDLSGQWAFQLDPDSRGASQGWHERSFSPKDTIRVPGVWQAQGFGKRRSQLRHDFQGKAWYQKRVVLPATWERSRVWLCIGGALRRTMLYVNGRLMGQWHLIMTPFAFDITDAIEFGAENVLTIQVDNLPRSGKWSPVELRSELGGWDFSEVLGGFNSFGNWGGIYRQVSIVRTGNAWIEWIHVRPDLRRKAVTVAVETGAASGACDQVTAEVRVVDMGGEEVGRATLVGQVGAKAIEFEIPVPEMHLWSPEDPYMYTTQVRLGEGIIDGLQQRFGIRQLSASRNHLYLNGKPYYLRGSSAGDGDPIEGMVPVRKEVYLERFRIARRMGFNHIRWHSLTPPQEAFEAADEVGMLMQVELPVGVAGFLMPHVEQLHAELERILLCHRNHPSFSALAFGNEFNVERDFDNDQERLRFLLEIERLYKHGKSLGPEILIMSNAGYSLYPTDMVSAYAGFVADRPTVKHESGGYRPTLPDIDLVERFTGVLLAEKLASKRKWLEKTKLIERYTDLRRHSERLQQAVRKRHFERTRQIRGLCGYQYWRMADAAANPYKDSLDDGILNYFWEHTKAVSEEEMRRINSATLLVLSSDVDDRTFWADRGKRVGLLVSHFGSSQLRDARVRWQILHGERTLAQGILAVGGVGLGNLVFGGTISIPALPLSRSDRVDLVAELEDASGQRSCNRWSFWAFARDLLKGGSVQVMARLRQDCLLNTYSFMQEGTNLASGCGLLVASALDAQAFEYLCSGGKLLWFSQLGQFDQQVATSYFPPMLTARGTLVEDHSAVSRFPHERHCDLQFFSLIEGSTAIAIPEGANLLMMSTARQDYQDGGAVRVPNTMRPIVWALETKGSWTAPERSLHRITWLVEARVAKGKLLLCTLNVLNRFDDAYPEAITFFDGLLRYALSDSFSPQGEVSPEELSGLLTPYLNG